MLIRDNGDGSYTASWTPSVSGVYHVQVKLDDFDAGLYLFNRLLLSLGRNLIFVMYAFLGCDIFLQFSIVRGNLFPREQ